jgi:hypothetical protein
MPTPTWLHAVLDLPADESGATGSPQEAFWQAALGWPLGEPWPDHPELASFVPPSGDPYVHRQTVAGPAGVHLDLEVPDVAAETARLVERGATAVRRTEDWQTLRSPGGLDFCLVASVSHGPRPAPVTTAAGHRRRLVQVCLDIPVEHLDVEPAFWRAALPGREVIPDSPEFLVRFVPAPGSTLQVLLQRLGDDDPARSTRAHLDLGSDDVAADAELLQGLGAVPLLDRGGFVALRDPAGLAFCTTENSPDAP